MLVKLADHALVERARLLRRRISITGVARGRRRRRADGIASETKTAMTVHSLGCRAISDQGEQEKCQHAR
jgi:hypothetical protein